jgi:hypothetical protein
VGLYVVGHFTLLFALTQLMRLDPVTRRAVPSFVAGFHAFSLQIGHLLEWGMVLFVVASSLALWRRSKLTRSDVVTIVRSIGASHLPLLVWVACIAALWLPLSLRLLRSGMSPVAMAQDPAWLGVAAAAFLTRYAANACAAVMLAWLLSREYQLGLRGATMVVLLPMLGISAVWHLIMGLLA